MNEDAINRERMQRKGGPGMGVFIALEGSTPYPLEGF